MIDIRRRTGFLFLAVTLGHLILISAQVNTRSGVRVLEAVTFGAFSGVQRSVAWVLGEVEGAWHRYVALRGLEAANLRLRQENAALGVQIQQMRARAMRGQRLEQLLQLREAVPQRTLPADVIAGDASSWFRTVTIDRGSRDGVAPDMAVIAPSGVVGRIVGDAAGRAARVQLLIDRTAGAGALIERSRAGGVVTGDGSGLRMEFVSNLADVRAGDLVVTSGLDGIYPKGFIIGEVRTVEHGPSVYKSISVRPAVDFSAIEEVLVVLDRPAVPKEGTE